tara:strand:+ start:232 stop:759 length:528 start_codon:yes stop_codon:yes gene_type:complete
MNKKVLIVILILSGGMFNSSIDENKSEDSNSLVFSNVSSIYSNRYSIETYITACDKLMHENGLFYSDEEVDECKKSVAEHYEQKVSEFDRPDFDFYTMKNTNQKATYTGDIYKIDIFGIYCENNQITNLLMDRNNCKTEDIGSIYITKNSLSDEWGYAAKGFETTNGIYLKVVRP